jgi:hypothetical protein
MVPRMLGAGEADDGSNWRRSSAWSRRCNQVARQDVDFISRRAEKPVADCNHLEPHRHLLQTQASTVHWGVKK